MAYPVLKRADTWFENSFGIKRSMVQKIKIVKSIPSGITGNRWDGSENNDGSITIIFDNTQSTIFICGNGSDKISMNPDSDWMFSCHDKVNFLTNLTTIEGLDLLDTVNVVLLSHICAGCSSLQNFIAHSWEAPNNTSLSSAFYSCRNLTIIDLPNLITSNVETLTSFAAYCEKLETVSIKNWNLDKNTNLNHVFYDCKSLAEIDIQISSACTTMNYTFRGCTNLNKLNTNRWNTCNVTSMKSTFESCQSLTELDIQISSACTTLKKMLLGCINIRTLPTSRWDTSNVNDMSYAFEYLDALDVFDVSHLEFGNVKTLCSAFSTTNGWSGVHTGPIELDFSHADFSNCEDISFMFWGQHRFTKLVMGNGYFPKLKNADHFIAHNDQLVDMDTSNWYMPVLENAYAMFHSFGGEVLDISGINFSRCKVFGQMFEKTKVKRIIGLENIDTNKGIDFCEMLAYMPNLEEVDLSHIDTRNARCGDKVSENGGTALGMKWFLSDTSNLKKLIIGEDFKFNGNGSFEEEFYATIPESKVPGFNGNWYTIDGKPHTPDEVKVTPGTYYATLDMVRNELVLMTNGIMIDIANAIRNVSGTTTTLLPEEMAENILKLKK